MIRGYSQLRWKVLWKGSNLASKIQTPAQYAALTSPNFTFVLKVVEPHRSYSRGSVLGKHCWPCSGEPYLMPGIQFQIDRMQRKYLNLCTIFPAFLTIFYLFLILFGGGRVVWSQSWQWSEHIPGSVLKITPGGILRIRVGAGGLNLGWLCERQVTYLLYYLSRLNFTF